jgi:hypothetical protein
MTVIQTHGEMFLRMNGAYPSPRARLEPSTAAVKLAARHNTEVRRGRAAIYGVVETRAESAKDGRGA